MNKRKQIPPEAKCVFKGEIFEVYQWQQEMFDGSFATFEALKRADAALVIPITTDGKIVVSEQEQPGMGKFTGFLGGQIEKDEEPLTGAKRELLEETGFAADNWQLWFEDSPQGKTIWTVYTYIARDCKKICEPNLDAGEKIKLIYLSFDEFLDFAITESFRDLSIKVVVLEALAKPDKMAELRQILQ